MIRFAIPTIGGRHWLGGWNYMRNMVRTLARHGDADIETHLFLGTDAPAETIDELRTLPRTLVHLDPAFSDDRVRGGIGRTLLTGRNAPLLAAFTAAGIDIAFTPAIYLGWRSQVASIAWFPDFQHRALPHIFSSRARIRRDLGFRAQIAASRYVMLSSADAQADCHRYFPASRGKTRIARFAIDLRDWPDAEEAARLVANAGIGQPYVFLPNQLWVHKNHSVVIRALALLRARGIDRTVIVSGRGHDHRRPDYPAELAAMVEAAGVADRFRMIGGVDHRLVKALMICAEALLNPSLFEGWSTTVEEAKTCGTPMLLSDLGVHREQAEGSAHFFLPDDAGALADALAAIPRRDMPAIREALAAAEPVAEARQASYAAALCAIIRDAAGSA